MFERHERGEHALLVHVNFGREREDERLQELKELARAAGATIVSVITATRQKPDPKFFVGSGKALEIAEAKAASGANLIIFNHTLSSSQEREMERVAECRVLDRNGLILDIFAQRALSHEGKLQVELAQLEHLSTRLIRGWTHLERQKGGIGLRGPGETQLETDRRLLRVRVRQLKEKLAQVKQRREQSRVSRRKSLIPTVALVGYTNAGKSTLFNTLTEAEVFASNQLFATLDPTCRHLDVGSGKGVMLVDTVGFVQDLPHELIEAFHATLQETEEADLLLHVVDASDELWRDRVSAVNAVLDQLHVGDKPQIRVFNKIDLLPGRAPQVDMGTDELPDRVWLSALERQGLEMLGDAIRARVSPERIIGVLTLPAEEARLRAALYQAGGVCSEACGEEGGFDLALDLDAVVWRKLLKRLEKSENDYQIDSSKQSGV